MHSNSSPPVWRVYALNGILLLAVLVCAFPGTFFRGECIVPGDILFQVPPWSHYAPEGFERPQNRLMADIVTLFQPWYALSQSAVAAGEWPLWNPLEFAGVPLLANNQSAVLYPPRLVFTLFDLHVATTIYVLLKLWLCGMAAFCCGRVFQLSDHAARFVSVGWMLAGFTFIWSSWSLTDVAGWAPLLVAGAELCATGQSRRGLFAMALGGALLLLAGHIVLSFTLALGICLYFVLRLVSERPDLRALSSRGLVFSSGWILAILVSAAMLLPFLEYMDEASKDFSLSAYGPEPGLGASATASFFVPRMFGTDAEGNFWGAGDSNQYGMLYPGWLVWLGVALLCGTWKGATQQRRRVVSLSLAALVGLLLAFDAGPFAYAHMLPGLSVIKHKYHVVFALFALPLLGAMGIERWFSQSRNPRETMWLALPVVLAAGAVAGVYLLNKSVLVMQGQDDYVRHHMVTATVMGALGVAALALGMFWRKPRVLFPLVTVLLVVDLIVASHGLVPTIPRAHAYPETKLTAFLQELDQPARVGVRHGGIASGTLATYGIEDWEGEGGMYPERIVTFLKTLGDDIWNAMEPACNVQYYLHDPRYPATFPLEEMPEHFELAAELDGIQVYKNKKALPRTYVVYELEDGLDEEVMFSRMVEEGFEPGRVALTTSAVDYAAPEVLPGTVPQAKVTARDGGQVSVDVTTEAAGVLVLSDAYYPGWEAEVDGVAAEIFPVFHAFRGVVVPAGAHTVTYQYRPTSFRVGLWVSSATLLMGLFAALLILVRQARRA
jgi:hypothetical protein